MKVCKICWKPRNHSNALISLCKECFWEKSSKDKKQTRIKQISDKKRDRLKKWKSEKKKFMDIAIKRAIDWVCKCEVCWKPIKLINLTHWNFDHEIPKSKWEEYRLDEQNIKIKCVSCHFKKTTWLNLKVEYNN